LAKAKLSQIPFVIVPSVTKMLRSNITKQASGKTNILAHFEVVGVIKMICPTTDLIKLHKCFDLKSFTSGTRASPQQIPFTVDGIPFSVSTVLVPEWIEAPQSLFHPIENSVYRVPVEETSKLQDIASLLLADASMSIASMFDVVPSAAGQHIDMNHSQLVVIWKNGPVGLSFETEEALRFCKARSYNYLPGIIGPQFQLHASSKNNAPAPTKQTSPDRVKHPPKIQSSSFHGHATSSKSSPPRGKSYASVTKQQAIPVISSPQPTNPPIRTENFVAKPSLLANPPPPPPSQQPINFEDRLHLLEIQFEQRLHAHQTNFQSNIEKFIATQVNQRLEVLKAEILSQMETMITTTLATTMDRIFVQISEITGSQYFQLQQQIQNHLNTTSSQLHPSILQQSLQSNLSNHMAQSHLPNSFNSSTAQAGALSSTHDE
jgi:hypothetical protein